jgi:hypothetical protein
MPRKIGDSVVITDEKQRQLYGRITAVRGGVYDIRMGGSEHVLTDIPENRVALNPTQISFCLRNNLSVSSNVVQETGKVTIYARGKFAKSIDEDGIRWTQKLEKGRTASSRSMTEDALTRWRRADDEVRGSAKNCREGTKHFSPEQITGLVEKLNELITDKPTYYRGPADSRMDTLLPQTMIPFEMQRFSGWLSENLPKCDDPIVLATQANVYLNTIHPFKDGNGRTCRLMNDFVLLCHGLPPSCFEGTMGVCNFEDLVPGLRKSQHEDGLVGSKDMASMVKMTREGVNKSLSLIEGSSELSSASTSPEGGLFTQIRAGGFKLKNAQTPTTNNPNNNTTL